MATGDKPAPTVSPYGSWKSPVTALLAGQSKKSYQDVCFDQHPDFTGKTVYYVTPRSSEGGRYVVRSLNLEQQGSDIVDWTPAGFNVRTRVHEYGGGSFFVNAGVVYFSNMSDQKIYKQTSPTAAPEVLTTTEDQFFADGCVNSALKVAYIVREDHTVIASAGAKEAANCVIKLDLTSGEQTVVASGADFYGCPRVSLDGSRLAWVEWNHPNMPWDDTRVMVGKLDPKTGLLQAGVGPVEFMGRGVLGRAVSAILPCWTRNNSLLYMSDQTGFFHLWRAHSPTEQTDLTPKEQADLAKPPWMFGLNSYDYRPASDTLVVLLPYKGLAVISNVSSATPSPMVTLSASSAGFTQHSLPLVLPGDQGVLLVSFSTSRSYALIKVDMEEAVVILEDVTGPLKDIDSEYWSVPRHVNFPTENGSMAYGWLYLPRNPDFSAPAGTLPPLLVRAHGGPTGKATAVLQLSMQFWTTRGFAVFDVDYRGSAGYGRAYRDALQGNWGLHDVADCCAAAQYLVHENLVDGDKLCIDGGSAGGFTTLGCLTFRNIFKAGASLYGVADVELLVKDTHKFESRYMDGLIGGTYPANKEICHERSAVYHINQINSPIIFFQGDDDKIVPPNQAVIMHSMLKKKEIPCALVMYEGEQHGFRKQENITHYLLAEFYFFSRIFGFTPADGEVALAIDNLPAS